MNKLLLAGLLCVGIAPTTMAGKNGSSFPDEESRREFFEKAKETQAKRDAQNAAENKTFNENLERSLWERQR